jgi:hypothetical protein
MICLYEIFGLDMYMANLRIGRGRRIDFEYRMSTWRLLPSSRSVRTSAHAASTICKLHTRSDTLLTPHMPLLQSEMSNFYNLEDRC